MHLRWHTVSLMAALLCVLMMGCSRWPDAEVSSTQHDKLLFEHAMSAVEQGRFGVANLTLQTLVNTYPDSEYASKAKELLEDPRHLLSEPSTEGDRLVREPRFRYYRFYMCCLSLLGVLTHTFAHTEPLFMAKEYLPAH
jgi:outer membrane protein assembly factor BamD (BamD/ComL family)